jgi:hypothetical protein
MVRRCARCAALLLPAEGPSLLWSGEKGTPRASLHLRCWLALTAEAASATAQHAAAATGGKRAAA